MIDVPARSVQWVFGSPPRGVILHGTRSGRQWTLREEFEATVRYVESGADGLGWHATIGEDAIALHLAVTGWGWNARIESAQWLAVEFAQPTVHSEITDAQVRVFCWWFHNVARRLWPNLVSEFVGHSELPPGRADGKTDPFPAGDPRMDELRHRILAQL